MNTLEKTMQTLQTRGEKAFVAFVTAGDPDMVATERHIRALYEGGVDVIELGIPFSDPIAEGEVLQRANLRALQSGTTLEKVFALCEKLQGTVRAPLVLSTYLNPVFRYGYEAFFDRCGRAGVGGIIVPDCPAEEVGEFYNIALASGVVPVTRIAPASQARIDRLAASARGFIYLIGDTCTQTDIADAVQRIRAVTAVPVCVGFNIAAPVQAAEAAKNSDGVIAASAIVRQIERYGQNAAPALKTYAEQIKSALLGQNEKKGRPAVKQHALASRKA